METAELQEEIKNLLAKLNWSQKRLGGEFYDSKYEFEDDDVERARYEEKAKKHLSRSTTKREILKSYLDVILHHDEFKKLDLVVPTYKRSGLLSEEMEVGMENISKLISNIVSE